MSTTKNKDARFNMKLKSKDKIKIEKAAELSGHTMSSFIINAALHASEEVIEKSKNIIESEEEAKHFYEILNKPARLNKNLSKSVERYKKVFE